MSPLDTDPADARTQRALRELAEQAARAGGAVARAHFGSPANVRLKADRSEVTDADETAQRAVVDTIRARRPDDAIIAEEPLRLGDPPPAPRNQQPCWLIDPIDGTRNYIRGIPLYTCAVAVMWAGYPLVGAIHTPADDRLVSASRAEGLFQDGRRLGDRPLPRSKSPKPIAAIPSSFSGEAEKTILSAWLGRVVLRNLGCTSLHLALVATGPLDATLISDSRLWDIAAGWLCIQAAGGAMTDLAGQPLFPLDVANYRGEALPSLAARDADTLDRLRPRTPTRNT